MEKSILHIVFNLNSYSGAALQANELRKHINIPSKILSIESTSSRNALNSSKEDCVQINPKASLLNYFKIMPEISRYDIVHMHGFSLPAMLVAVFLRKKIILKTTLFGDDDFFSLRKKRFGWLRGVLTRFVKLNIALSEEIFKINKEYINQEKIIKIPNGVCLPPGLPGQKSKAIFCTVGVISPRKGISNTVKYFNEHYANLPGAQLYVVGPRPADKDFNLLEGNMQYYNECLKIAKESPASVIFTGKLEKEDLKKIYEESIGFIFFSEREGMPNVLLEAMSYNCVPVTGPISGAAMEIIDDKKNGFIVHSLNDKVSFEDITALSESGAPQKKIAKFFDIKIVAKKYSKIYENI